jgi:D-apionolactonase
MLNNNAFVEGGTSQETSPLRLSAGRLTVIFEPENGFVRYVRIGDHELVRSIYAVVRDHQWTTIPWRVRNLHTVVESDSFELNFDVDCEDGAVRYAWHGRVSGSPEGQVVFSFEGVAQSSFSKNRIGICVLHPIAECAGKPCLLEHTDGRVEPTSFPKDISPAQPLMDVRSITHEVANGVRCGVRFEGEVFETEDQRNFGDMSFKTYSTPQDLPKPVQVNMGDRVNHRVTVTLLNPEKKTLLPVTQGRPPQISISTSPITSKPALGLQLRRDFHPANEREVARLRALKLAHVRADLMLTVSDWQAHLRAAIDQANAIGTPLHLAFHLGENAENELTNLVGEVQALRAKVSLWIVYRSGEGFPRSSTIQLARNKLSVVGATVIAAAASPFYAEFNRNRPAPDAAILPCVPVTPQIHLTDRNTMIENIAASTELIDTAATILPRQIVLSPITLKRSEPKASKMQSGDSLPPTVDPRQSSLFAAGWTLGHIAQISTSPHLHSATYFETTGWRGIMET